MLPPKDVTPSALFLKLKATPAPSEVVDFPRRGVSDKVRVMVLPMPRHDEARLRGEEWLQRQNVSPEAKRGEAAKQVLGDRIARELIAMAVQEVEPIEGSEATGAPRYRRIFANADDVGILTADEINALFTAYVMTQSKYGPHEGNVTTDAEVTAWIKRLAEGASQFPLSLLSSQDLAELSFGLAKRAYTLSAIVDSQLSTLPPTLASHLQKWAIGTGSFTWRACDSGTREAMGLPAEPDAAEAEPAPATYEQLIPDTPITMSDAIRIAEQMKAQS